MRGNFVCVCVYLYIKVKSENSNSHAKVHVLSQFSFSIQFSLCGESCIQNLFHNEIVDSARVIQSCKNIPTHRINMSHTKIPNWIPQGLIHTSTHSFPLRLSSITSSVLKTYACL